RVARRDDGAVRLAAADLGVEERYPSVAALADAVRDRRTQLPLHARAVLAVWDRTGVEVESQAASPRGAGLGGSSALLVTAVSTLSAARGVEMAPTTALRVS